MLVHFPVLTMGTCYKIICPLLLLLSFKLDLITADLDVTASESPSSKFLTLQIGSLFRLLSNKSHRRHGTYPLMHTITPLLPLYFRLSRMLSLDRNWLLAGLISLLTLCTYLLSFAHSSNRSGICAHASVLLVFLRHMSNK